MALCQVETLLNKEPVGIVLISREGEMCAEVVLCFLIVILAEDIGRIADDCIKAATFHNFWILGLPVEGIDAVAFFLIEETHLFVIIKIWPDKGVTTLNVVAQIRQHSFMEQSKLGGQTFLRLTLQYLEQQ